MKTAIRTAYAALCAAVMLTANAFAYLDPSTTTALIQVIAGLAVAGGVAFGVFRHKIKRLFQKKSGETSEQQTAEKASGEDMFD